MRLGCFILAIIFFVSLVSENNKETIAMTSAKQYSIQLDTLGLSSFLSSFELDKNSSLTFKVPNDQSKFAVLYGYIDSTTPKITEQFIRYNPTITTLVFMQIDGSNDDEANLKACQQLNQLDYIYYLPGVEQYKQDAFIASGGVDMFFSGKIRIVEPTAEVGVHSWSDGVHEATDFPKNDSIHLEYIDYYKKIGLTNEEAEAFYFFTINAAQHDSIYFMTNKEISKYNLRNK